MSGTPMLAPAPAMSPRPAEKIDSEAAVDSVLKQYDGMKLTSEDGEKSLISPEGTRADVVHDKYDFELPVIDLSPVVKLRSLRKEIEESLGGAKSRSSLEEEIEACDAAKLGIAKSVRAAFEEYGFFQIINHVPWKL